MLEQRPDVFSAVLASWLDTIPAPHLFVERLTANSFQKGIDDGLHNFPPTTRSVDWLIDRIRGLPRHQSHGDRDRQGVRRLRPRLGLRRNESVHRPGNRAGILVEPTVAGTTPPSTTSPAISPNAPGRYRSHLPSLSSAWIADSPAPRTSTSCGGPRRTERSPKSVVPAARWDIDRFHSSTTAAGHHEHPVRHTSSTTPTSSITRPSGSPRLKLAALDPQQRLVLELSGALWKTPPSTRAHSPELTRVCSSA